MMEATTLLSVAPKLRNGKIGIIPTDTIYGFVASALLPEAIARLYEARGRNEQKPCIVLVDSIEALDRFGRALSNREREILNELWPGKVSVVFSGFDERFSSLHRGSGTIAFRIPDVPLLRDMLRISGPIIAPSANPEGMKSSESIEEAESYFSDRADFFVDGGKLSGAPSTIIRLENGEIELLRVGASEIPQRYLNSDCYD